MITQGVVVADTTPLNYLILIGQAGVLRELFGEVVIPDAVLSELRHPKAPAAVANWLLNPPDWLTVENVARVDQSIQLGQGEVEAISLAVERQISIVLMDERRGRLAAEARGLLAVGTLNILDLADERELLDGVVMLEALRQTTFRADTELLDRLEARMRSRKA
jgi:predicted nucleic acid-binding protein